MSVVDNDPDVSLLTLEEELLLTEISSSTKEEVRYSKTREKDVLKIDEVLNNHWYISAKSILKDVFLPEGYPDSVSSDYLEYQIWDTLQAFCSSISNTLTIRAIMQGIGVGSDKANPASAAITWVLKNGIGMLGSILFTWARGSRLDSDCKKWRLCADVLNDIAMFIEVYIPHYINHSNKLLCLATIFKALVGTAGSSTRAALITHQAVTGNVADVTAKDGSQEICTNLVALIIGIFLLKYVTHQDQIWTVMCTATFFHLYFNYKAVKCIKFRVFNRERFRLGCKTYFITSIFPNVELINNRESIYLFIGTTDYDLCGFTVEFGECIKNSLSSHGLELSTVIALFQDKKYLIIMDTTNRKLFVTFRKQFHDSDVIKAYFHSFLLGIAFTFLTSDKKLLVMERCRKNSPLYKVKNILSEFLAINAETQHTHAELENILIVKSYMVCEDIIENEFNSFSENIKEQGWTMESHLINIGDWRGVWKLVEEKKDLALKRLTKKLATHHHSKRRSKGTHGWSNLIIS